jgi:UDP-N-acetylmuramoyl-L-alanyl-D-glutamate--2,6-diaminopimelate ligase
MKALGELLRSAHIPLTFPHHSAIVTSLCTHSKECKAGSIFFGFQGQSSDGSRYAEEALQNGAILAIVDEEAPIDDHQSIIRVKNPHKTFALMNAAFHDNPQTELKLIAVTGTDGKSSTADILHQLLSFEGMPTGLFSTTSIDDGTGKIPSPYRISTPEADLLYPFLDRCRSNRVEYVIIEATSHALSEEYSRLYGLSFEIGIITTLSGDHIEFHGSKEAYLEAKLSLLGMIRPNGHFISSIENRELKRCLTRMDSSIHVHILGRDHPYTVEEDTLHSVRGTFEGQPFTIGLGLTVLATNALLALLASSVITHKPPVELLPHLASVRPLKGRMQSVPNDKGIHVIIDYAHTIGAYEHLFSFIRQIRGKSRVITVMGAAGGRDKEKRSVLGGIASEESDVLILTEEDPAFEELHAINAMIKRGIALQTCRVFEIDDRNLAIAEAIRLAEEGDIVLLLGKGHEQSIQRTNRSIPWDEEKAVLEVIG